MKMTLERDRMGNYTLTAEDGRSQYFQVDYDHASLASHLGWSVEQVQWARCKDCDPTRRFVIEPDQGDCPCPEECPDCDGTNVEIVYCDHSFSDGTIDCSACGMKTMSFINSAQGWLTDHCDQSFDDATGYFNEE
jgi:hypothetical protein